jgi:uncharacterized membrane protein
METVEETIDVGVPVSTAYNQWTQFESFPNFMSGVESVTQLTDTTNHWITKIGGVEREFDTEIVEQHPDQRIAWRAVTFERLGADSTKVAVRFEWDPETFTEKAGAKLGIDSAQVKSDLKKFKEFVENRGTETGAWRGEVDDIAAGSAGQAAANMDEDLPPGRPV